MLRTFAFLSLLLVWMGEVVDGQGIRWCCKSGSEEQKCNNWVNALADNTLKCVVLAKDESCDDYIAQGKADLATFKGTNIKRAGKNHGLKPIAGISRTGLPDKFTGYYAVAVVAKGSTLTFDNMKDTALSCHTGVMKSSGWIVPIGHLIRTKRIKLPKDCDVYSAVGSFFKASCAPGANDPNYNKHKSYEKKLCQLCKGDAKGENKCKRGSEERYYGYTGALQCLKDKSGDVAFIKQSTILSDANKDQYSLLCPNNTKAAVAQYRSCNLARVPELAVLTSKDKSDTDVVKFQQFLKLSDQKFGSSAGQGQKFKLFDGVIFTASTAAKIDTIPKAEQSVDMFLDQRYYGDVEALETCETSTAIALVSSLYVMLAGAISVAVTVLL